MLNIELEEEGPLLLRKTLVRRALNSIGSREYRELYIGRDNGTEEEVIYDGDLACAYYCSTPYHAFGLLESVHTTVKGLEQEVGTLCHEWILVEAPLPGAVVFWETKIGNDGKNHRHIGICVSDTEAVHHDAVTKSPKLDLIYALRHHTGELRKVEVFYIHKRLLDD